MSPKIIQNKTLAERAYMQIKEAILTNEYLLGQELSIGSLAEALGISPTPVREALARLSNEGLIEYHANRKARVSTINEVDVLEIYEARRLLEPYVATRVPEALSRDSRLKNRLLALRTKTEKLCEVSPGQRKPREYSEVDLQLNDIMLRAVKSGLLREIVTLVENRSLRTRTVVEATCSPSRIGALFKTAEEHLRIIDALLSGDRVRIREAVLSHLTNGETRTLEVLSRKHEEGVAA
jgi:DNA-binding GntR family transcriptional regulator